MSATVETDPAVEVQELREALYQAYVDLGGAIEKKDEEIARLNDELDQYEAALEDLREETGRVR